MKYGEKGHTPNDSFKIFADYVYTKMKILPVDQWRNVFKTLTENTQHDIEEVRQYVLNKLERDGLI